MAKFGFIGQLFSNKIDRLNDEQSVILALSVAARNGHELVIKSLLEHGAAVNQVNKQDGKFSLILAVINGHEPVVKLLLEHGANPNQIHVPTGYTSLSIARQNVHDSIVSILIAAGATD